MKSKVKNTLIINYVQNKGHSIRMIKKNKQQDADF